MMLVLAVQSCLAKDAPLLSLSMEHFRDSATVMDDPIAGVTKVDTEKGFVEHHGLLGAVWNDEYLSATIDRKTDHRSFEVIATITYRGARRTYGSAQFQGAKGPVVVPVLLLKTNSVNCPTGECTYTDHISFSVEESMLRASAARPAVNKPEVWRYTVVAKSGGNFSGELSNAEIAGFLAKVDEYTGAAPPVVRPTAAAKPELGIGGLHVEASVRLPARGGVLVTAVSPGSVADKAGIIVGDIVREIDGHPVKAPPDMQAAIAAAAADAAITIKVYRGMTEVTLAGQL
jgi:membrane-associated protease RseP (regulator of RpoE activity)